MKDQSLIDYVTDLEKKKEDIIFCAKILTKKKICLFDTFCIAQLNRSLNLIDAFVTLAKMDNYITAFALVRLHLDTLLRIFAIKLTNRDVNQIVREILNGTKIEKLKDGTTKHLLKDFYLKNKLSEIADYSWVKETYEKSSDFVHFSDTLLKSSNLGDVSAMKLKHSVKVGSDFIKDLDKKVACVQMIKITEGILGFIFKWIDQSAKNHESH
jgi:aspartate carbamoyltransferase regulatory subunit